MTLEPSQPGQPDQPEPEAAAAADGKPDAKSEPAPSEAIAEQATTPGPEPVAAPVAAIPEPAPAVVAAPAETVPVAAAAAAPPLNVPPTAPPAWQPPAVPVGPFPGVRFADHGPRLISFILDHLIILGISLVILAAFLIVAGIFAAIGVDFLAATSVIAAIVGFFVVYFVYFPYFWTKNGQTLGMRPFKLRVVMDKDGGKVTMGPAILRLIGYWIDQIIFYLGYIWVLIDNRRRGWHDLIAGTVVIQEE
ncbi:MAG TPA: RDD family protein [Candidatus Limnocylindrales bacterium]